MSGETSFVFGLVADIQYACKVLVSLTKPHLYVRLESLAKHLWEMMYRASATQKGELSDMRRSHKSSCRLCRFGTEMPQS